MKSYAGNWQINRNSRNQMSKKILSERIPLNGQWNNRTSPTWPETRHGREGRSRISFYFFFYFFYKIDEIKWDRAIPDNWSWNRRVLIEPAVILPDLSVDLTVFCFPWQCQVVVIRSVFPLPYPLVHTLIMEGAYQLGMCHLTLTSFTLSAGFLYVRGIFVIRSVSLLHVQYKCST